MGADDSDGGDRILRLTGVALVVAILGALAVIVIAGALAPSSGEAAPDANWSVSRVNDSAVEVAHAGGEQIRANELVVTVNGKVRHPTVPPVVSEGDTFLLQTQPGQTVRLFWESSPGDRTRLHEAAV